MGISNEVTIENCRRNYGPGVCRLPAINLELAAISSPAFFIFPANCQEALFVIIP